MFLQRRDEDKVIELARNINTIKARFGAKPILTGGGNVELWDTTEEIQESPKSEKLKKKCENENEHKVTQESDEQLDERNTKEMIVEGTSNSLSNNQNTA